MIHYWLDQVSGDPTLRTPCRTEWIIGTRASARWEDVDCQECQKHRPPGAVLDPKAGMKFDGGKVEWFDTFQLLPWDEVRDVGQVLIIGAEKYNKDNWKYVERGWIRYFNAMMRHLMKRFVKGEINDPDDGLSHLAHACCDLLFLMWIDKQPTTPGEVPRTTAE